MPPDWYCDQVLAGTRAIGVVAETGSVLAFHHTMPSYAAAHVVVIPKVHITSLLSEDAPAVLPEIMAVVRAIAADVVDEFGACRVVTNLGEYQDSKHMHWHVVSGERIIEPVEVSDPTWRPWR